MKCYIFDEHTYKVLTNGRMPDDKHKVLTDCKDNEIWAAFVGNTIHYDKDQQPKLHRDLDKLSDYVYRLLWQKVWGG